MTNQEFNDIVHHMVGKIRENTPRRTKNLMNNATKSKSLGADRFVIFVDTEIAPYFKYVNNEPLIRREVKVGNRKAQMFKRNRNYQYWQKAVDLAIEDIAKALGGRVER